MLTHSLHYPNEYPVVTYTIWFKIKSSMHVKGNSHKEAYLLLLIRHQMIYSTFPKETNIP